VFLARAEDIADESNFSQMAYMAEIQVEREEETINISNPRFYAANNKD
jgi:hypothetical protein